MKKTIIFFIFLLNSFVLFPRELKEIKQSGYLMVGIRNIPSETIYQPEVKDKPGFCYELIKKFADSLGLEVKLKIVSNIDEYFLKNGQNMLTNPDLTGNPDILESVDVVADIISITDDRKKIVNMIPFAENVEILFTRKDEKINNTQDLRGRTIFTGESFSFYKFLIPFLQKRGIKYIENKVKVENNVMSFLEERKKRESNEVEILLIPRGGTFEKFVSYYQVMLGNADMSIADSFSFFNRLSNTLIFKESIKPLFPSNDNLGYLGFITSYKTKDLNKQLSEFINLLKGSSDYDKLFEKYIGIKYTEYRNILQLVK